MTPPTRPLQGTGSVVMNQENRERLNTSRSLLMPLGSRSSGMLVNDWRRRMQFPPGTARNYLMNLWRRRFHSIIYGNAMQYQGLRGKPYKKVEQHSEQSLQQASVITTKYSPRRLCLKLFKWQDWEHWLTKSWGLSKCPLGEAATLRQPPRPTTKDSAPERVFLWPDIPTLVVLPAQVLTRWQLPLSSPGKQATERWRRKPLLYSNAQRIWRKTAN